MDYPSQDELTAMAMAEQRRKELERDYPLTDPERRAVWDSSEWFRYAHSEDASPLVRTIAKMFEAHPSKIDREAAMMETIRHLDKENARLMGLLNQKALFEPLRIVVGKEG